MIIIKENDISNPGSNPRQGFLHFTLHWWSWEEHESIFSDPNFGWLGSFDFIKQLIKKKNSEFKSALLVLKIYLVLHCVHDAQGEVNIVSMMHGVR